MLFVGVGVFGALFPSVSYAAELSSTQANAILGLLRAFGAEEKIVASVSIALGIPAETASATVPSQTQASTTSYVRPATLGSLYPSSGVGYDISYNTKDYPQPPFGFAVIGVTAGKAFTANQRLFTEYDWARLSSATSPTFYLNLNAPYGSSATTANVTGPKACDTLFGPAKTSAASGGTYPEPTPCAAYNYGYNTAKHAYAYAANLPYVSSSFWWLDVEEANSWSDDTAVNDEVIQGAIDYLNSKDIRVGVYSVPYMWKNIAGAGFTPTQNAKGQTSIPTWFPIGISTQVKALNACLDRASFIPGSPVWIIQYELDRTSVDQNVAC